MKDLMYDAVAKYVSRFRSLGLDGTPLNEHEIDALERHLILPLPDAYRAYLLVAGSSPPRALVGSDCHGQHLLSLHTDAKALLQECGEPFELPTEAVVFLMHQGYQFLYFFADGITQDPPVWYYLEAWSAPVCRMERFTDWVASCVGTTANDFS